MTLFYITLQVILWCATYIQPVYEQAPTTTVAELVSSRLA